MVETAVPQVDNGPGPNQVLEPGTPFGAQLVPEVMQPAGRAVTIVAPPFVPQQGYEAFGSMEQGRVVSGSQRQAASLVRLLNAS